ncbi:sigma-70 family RNA polymerase sigma factor [Streptomyces sp. YIM 98790]|uniref:sigma-70 family RNA polymerase sigma factor n=1 Tax=Streptomyces sp. YIM 98790 TaxID=2689077 RepID=UPI001408C762|nr:sigma-70 family RNA polymerase sigma factor [Streptomyces sp. YIM 98790]
MLSPRPAPEEHLRQDEQFLRAVLDQHRSRLLHYVHRLTGDLHRAEDVVQEALVRVWLTQARTPLPADRVAPWLHRVARNLAVDAHRRDRSVPMGMLPPELLQRADGTDVADTVATRQVVRRALSRLSPEHRDAVVTVLLHDLSGAEAARALGVPAGTVKSRLHYALRALRRDLERAGGGSADRRRPDARHGAVRIPQRGAA